MQRKHPQVRRRLEELLVEGRVAGCQMVSLEFLNNAPDPKAYETIWAGLHGHRWIDVTAEAMTRALANHRALARISQHRNFKLPDLIIAATAEVHGAVVLHYDKDFDRIAAITEQPTEWVAPQGSL
jgi:predicted nucleic acid-binding protein